MSDDREFWDEQAGDNIPDGKNVTPEDAFPLLSADDFDEELEALAVYATGDEPVDEVMDTLDDEADEADEIDSADAVAFDALDDADEFGVGEVDEIDDVDDIVEIDIDETGDEDTDEFADLATEDAAVMASVMETGAIDEDVAPAVDDEDRLRPPRAGRFRRMLRNQLGMLPLSLLLIAVGGYLLAREQEVSGLPDLTDGALAVISVVTVGFAAVFHALLSGRRERGLLYVGLWILSTTGLIAALVFGIDKHPDAIKWWPLLLWSTALALLLTYLIERMHDARLIFLAIVAFVAGLVAYLVTAGWIANDTLHDVADYWPLLLTILGVGLLPLVFQRRAE